MREAGAERGAPIEPVTSELPDGLFDANGLENGLSLKRLDSELHPARRTDTVAATTSRAGEQKGPTRVRICYSRGRDNDYFAQLNTAQVNKALSKVIPSSLTQEPLRPSQLVGFSGQKRHETHREQVLTHKTALLLAKLNEPLHPVMRPKRQHHDATLGQLPNQ